MQIPVDALSPTKHWVCRNGARATKTNCNESPPHASACSKGETNDEKHSRGLPLRRRLRLWPDLSLPQDEQLS